MAPKISIIIPILNEAEVITQTLSALQPLRARGHEVIVVDGGSEDASLMQSQPLADRVIHGPTGSFPPDECRSLNRQWRDPPFFTCGHLFARRCGSPHHFKHEAERGRIWGHFDVRLSGKHPLFRIIEYLMNWRSRLTGIATGDQGIFVRQ